MSTPDSDLAVPEGDPWALPVRRRPSDGTHLVNEIRAAVDAWRSNGYPGASPTTRRLFTYWFEEDHLTPDGMPFRFYFCQREAVETFVFLTEVREVRSIRDLLDFASHGMLIQPGETLRQRLAFKMATGSGKTMAMSLCVVWAYFHAIFEPGSPMATKFLIVAPNVIVFERLRTDFEDGGTFRRDPLIPPEWANDFEMTVLLQDELAPATTRGIFYLTNIQRLYDSSDSAASAPINPVDAMVGGRVNRDVNAASAEQLVDRIAESGRLMVINDEAHHVWSQKLKWNQAIESLHDKLSKQNPNDRRAGVVSQLDFSATPKDQRGILFRHIVVDYPLAQAVRDGIVKTPLIGEIHGATPELGTSAVQRYRRWLDVAVGRWRKFNEALEPAGKRPVLFVMCENTQAADEVGDYLRQRQDFSGDRLLVIHTNRQGEVTKDDLDIARRAAREVDGPESRIRCIVSVLMLREGWDVRNVCVIVTLRSLTAKAKILPEQALGRGLRRMTPPGSGFDERVVVIEHDAFRDLWSSELDGGLVVEKEDVDRIEAGAIAIFADEAKRDYDIAIPHLSRVLARSQSPMAELHATDVADPVTKLDVPDVSPDEYIKYRGLHLIGRTEVERDEFLVPYAEDPSGVITWYTKSVAKAAGVDRLAGTFAILAPMVRDYLKTRVFTQPVDLADKIVLRRLAENDAQQIVVGAFQAAIRSLAITEVSPELQEQSLRLSATPAFAWSRETVSAARTVFNLTPVDNALERRFAQFLDHATDVRAFAKLTMNSRFALEYISTTGVLRYYYPDFLVRLTSGDCVVMETKGLEDVEVALKDQRARRWCRDATALSGVWWGYEKVPQRVFDAYTGETIEGLRRFIVARDGHSGSEAL